MDLTRKILTTGALIGSLVSPIYGTESRVPKTLTLDRISGNFNLEGTKDQTLVFLDNELSAGKCKTVSGFTKNKNGNGYNKYDFKPGNLDKTIMDLPRVGSLDEVITKEITPRTDLRFLPKYYANDVKGLFNDYSKVFLGCVPSKIDAVADKISFISPSNENLVGKYSIPNGKKDNTKYTMGDIINLYLNDENIGIKTTSGRYSFAKTDGTKSYIVDYNKSSNNWKLISDDAELEDSFKFDNNIYTINKIQDSGIQKAKTATANYGSVRRN